jgi:type III pantothenate kinase
MKDSYQLIFDVGNTKTGAAYFQQDIIVETTHFMSESINEAQLEKFIQDKTIEVALIGSVHYRIGHFIYQFLKNKNIKVIEVGTEKLSVILDVENPTEVGSDRIASTYGALYSHPNTDIIVINMGFTLVFDVIARERRFLGGAITIGPYLCAKALSSYTDLLPLVEIKKPKSCVAKSTSSNIQSGIYYGMIGTIEHLLKEIKSIFFGSGNVLVIATGDLSGAIDAEPDSSVHAKLRSDLESDLKKSINFFEPDLIFYGYHEILKEKLERKK